jgi:hypothetical protein
VVLPLPLASPGSAAHGTALAGASTANMLRLNTAAVIAIPLLAAKEVGRHALEHGCQRHRRQPLLLKLQLL